MGENSNTAIVPTKERAVAELTKTTQEWISKAISSEEIKCPKGYDYQGEIYLALMKLATETKTKDGRFATEVCTHASIMSELKKMVKNGWSLAKSQCYPIIYGDKLSITPSYFGKKATVERIIPGSKVYAEVLREGDDYEYVYNEDTESYEIKNIKPRLENIDNPIVAVFGCVKKDGKKIATDVMSWNQILASWSHAKTDAVQKQHPSDMARRTLVNHMCKTIINSSTEADSNLVAAYNEAEADDNDFSEERNITPQNDKGLDKFDRLMGKAEDAKQESSAPKEIGSAEQEIPF